MPKTCGQCEYYSEDSDQEECPQCGTMLRFTMLPRPRTQEQMAVEPTEFAETDARFELLELPISVRLTQIVSGIVMFFAVTRWGSRAFQMLTPAELEIENQAQIWFVLGYMAFIYIAASLVAGATAGAWSVNWIPQGIGVATGVLLIPLILLTFIQPESPTWYLVGVFATTLLTLFGAFIGHKLIRPTRFLIS